MKIKISRVVSFLLVALMLIGLVPLNALAESLSVDYTEKANDYYKVITKDDYQLAPGIVESEIVLNNSSGSHRQVAHVVEVDLENEYTKVMPSYKGMVPTPGNYGVQIMSEQAKWAEANGYGNVVAAMNLSLSWYDSNYYVQHPELVGEPLGYMVLDGEVYMNSNGQTGGAQSCVVINFDEKDGEARPTNIPKVEIRSTSSKITGWEEQVIPANFGFLVKNGVNQYGKDNNAANGASRSFVGIKEDGTFVMVMNDGRQSPYSAGFTNYEMAEFMLSLGCVQAVNGDGGGSSAFLSQRPGEELKLNCSPSDGAERPTTHGILVVSTAPATGEFVRANITTDNDYYTPGSTVEFTALGTDLVGTPAEIPSDVVWQLADNSMGTIDNGVFVSNGKTGTATAQMVYNGAIVGEASVEIVIPTEFAFSQGVMTVPFDKEVTIAISASINNGLHNVVLKPEDVTFTTDNDALGSFNGFQFTSVNEENAPAKLSSTLTATLVHDTSLVSTASLSLGKGSEVLFDFESADDIEAWNIADVNGNDKGFNQVLSYATETDGQVHDGIGSMRVEMNPISANGIPSGGYAQSDLFLDEGVVVENAKSIGFWAYIPDEYVHCWIRVLYWYDSNNDGKFDKKNTITVINQPDVYNKFDESGWKYFSVDVSAYSKVLIPGLDSKDNFGYNAANNDANNFRFIEFMFPHTNTNDLWKTYGTINGLQTVYVDNITADYSDAVDDREAPVFGTVTLAGNDVGIELAKHSVVSTASNSLTVTATVSENTAKTNATGLDVSSAKAYVDGVAVPVTYANGRLTISDVFVADGCHRIKFEICDNMCNKSVVIRMVNVVSGNEASTVQVVPADSTLDRLYGGSVYWMNINANAIETIQSVKTVIDLNYGNHWELDHMTVADGFTSAYTIDKENNTATITITRTGKNTQTGEATLAELPIRVIYYDTDINIDGYTAESYWKTYAFWPYDLKVDVDMGEIIYVDGYTSDVLGAFSNEKFSVDTELYTVKANMDQNYYNNRGTAHVHTEIALDDVAATCTADGLKGRTYCEVCDSIVNWGEVIPTTGHSVSKTDGLNTCDHCDDTFYLVDGVAQFGWINADGKYYYCDANGVAVNNSATIDGHTYTFTDFVLTDAAWEHDGVGLTAWWAGEQVKGGTDYNSKWKEFNGKKYYFTNIYAATGLVQVKISTDAGYKYHIFGDDGAWLEDYTGLYEGVYEGKAGTYYVENGICIYAGLVYVDGYYYYINSSFTAVKSSTYYVSRNNDLLPKGEYEFDAEGKMINPPADEPTTEPTTTEPTTEPSTTPVVKNGIVEEDGKLYFYENNVKIAKGLYKDANGDYYVFGINYYALGEGEYWLNDAKLNGLAGPNGKLLKPGFYKIGADCKVNFADPKNGIVEEDGKLYFYENDVKVAKGLYKDANGDYYVFGIKFNALGEGEYWLNDAKLNGLAGPDGKALQPGFYKIGADCKVIFADPKNGIVEENGKLYFYENDVKVAKGLYKDANGDYYVFGIKFNALGEGEYWLNDAKLNGLTGPDGKALQPGFYKIGADCKVIFAEPKNGIVEENGKLYFYENDVKVAKGLCKDANGDYYVFGIKFNALGEGEYWLNEAKLNGLAGPDGKALQPGFYKIGADCKVIF